MLTSTIIIRKIESSGGKKHTIVAKFAKSISSCPNLSRRRHQAFLGGQFGKNKALRNLPVFRAAAVSTSEDKIVSKSDAAQNSEERKSKN